VGIDYKNFGGEARNEYTDGTPTTYSFEDKSLNEIAGYVLAQQTLFEKLTLNAGLRLENNENFGSEWVPQAGLSYRPLRHTVLKAMISKGFRSPTMREMYMYVGEQNPELKPERMMNYELSVGQGFFGGQLTVELTGYIANGSNLIITQMVEVEPGNSRSKNMNVGNFNNKGIELSVRWNVVKDFNLMGNYSYLNMEKKIVNAPEQQAYIAVSYRLDKWSLSANYQYIHGLYIVTGDAPVTKNYGLLNAKVLYRPLRWLDVFVKGENLTDKSYQIVNGYPMPGITLFGGVNLKFGN
jgi:iron complex outermembrane receptor protein